MVPATDTVSSSTVIDALVQQARNQKHRYEWAVVGANKAQQEVTYYSDEKSSALEGWHQVVDFLDLHFPGWEVNLDEEQRKGIRPL